MKIRGFLKELRHRGVFKVAVAYTATGIVVLEVVTHLFHNFEAPHWVLKVITTLLILGLPIACLMAWGFEFKEGRVRTVPREPEEAKPALPGPEVTAPPPSIAVLPFEDMSAEHDQQYLGNGIAEELLNALASVEGLNVAARTSSFSFASKGASMKEIGETLHVRHVLEGSVRRSGQKLRVTAQLIDVESGFHRYSQSYDRELQDIFDIQNEIAREIAGALLPRLGLGKDVVLVKHGTTNLQAYNLRLQARPWLTAPDPVTSSAAIDKLRQALELDPRYWDAWGDLAYVKGYMTSWTGDPVPLLVDAEAAATLALYHSPTNVIALLWRAFVSMLVNHDPAAAADYYERARRAGVDQSLWAFQKAYCYDVPLGRFDAGIELLTDAERNDPLASSVKGGLIEMYLGAGRLVEAVAVAETALAQKLTGFDALTTAGRAFVANGDFRRARELLDRSRTASGENFYSGMLLQFELDAATGDRASARQRIERLLQRRTEDFGVSCFVIGEGYKALGDYDHAIQWWTSAVERHETWTLTLLAARNRNHPVIGRDPRFLALLRRMGLEGPPGGGAR